MTKINRRNTEIGSEVVYLNGYRVSTAHIVSAGEVEVDNKRVFRFNLNDNWHLDEGTIVYETPLEASEVARIKYDADLKDAYELMMQTGEAYNNLKTIGEKVFGIKLG